jgi:hypothetical protein
MKKFFVFNILVCFLFGSDVDYNDIFVKGVSDGVVTLTKGVTDNIISIVSNPESIIDNLEESNKRLSCNNKYWDFKHKSDKIYFSIKNENNEIKKILKRRYINYSIFLKNIHSDNKIDYALIKKESCSRSYYDMRVNAEKNMFRVIQENKILRDIAKKNYIVLGNELVDNHSFDVVDTDIRKDDVIEHRNAMNDLRMQLLH